MMLKYSDVYAALYRVTDMYSPLFRVVSVRTRYVRLQGSVAYREVLQASDHVRVGSRLRHGLYIGGAALGVTAIGGRLK